MIVQEEKRGGKYKKKFLKKEKERRKNKTKIIRTFAVYFLPYNMVHEREGKGIKKIYKIIVDEEKNGANTYIM